jgi:hypothetical protein
MLGTLKPTVNELFPGVIAPIVTGTAVVFPLISSVDKLPVSYAAVTRTLYDVPAFNAVILNVVPDYLYLPSIKYIKYLYI